MAPWNGPTNDTVPEEMEDKSLERNCRANAVSHENQPLRRARGMYAAFLCCLQIQQLCINCFYVPLPMFVGPMLHIKG